MIKFNVGDVVLCRAFNEGPASLGSVKKVEGVGRPKIDSNWTGQTVHVLDSESKRVVEWNPQWLSLVTAAKISRLYFKPELVAPVLPIPAETIPAEPVLQCQEDNPAPVINSP